VQSESVQSFSMAELWLEEI